MVVGLMESGVELQPNVLRYLNRLSDVLWLFGRLIEHRMGLDARLRENAGPRWSRAW
jgi:cob(I)alamin adenosyltransferase